MSTRREHREAALDLLDAHYRAVEEQCARQHELDVGFFHTVTACRNAGLGWDEIAYVLHMSPSGVRGRYMKGGSGWATSAPTSRSTSAT